MFRRGEPVPFAFIAEAERYRSNVAPPPRPHRTFAQRASSVLVGVSITTGLVGALLLGGPALDPAQQPETGGSTAAEGR